MKFLKRLNLGLNAEEADRIPFKGFVMNGPGDTGIERARETFVWAFASEFEEPTKNRLLGRVRSFDRDAFEALAELGLDVKYLAERGQAPAPDLLAYAPIGRADADKDFFRDSYADFVRWIPEPEVRARVERERDAVGAAAPRLLDLKRLEEEYASELVVIGVHSAKFLNEGDTDNIRQVVQRYEIEHPVVNDADFQIWQRVDDGGFCQGL